MPAIGSGSNHNIEHPCAGCEHERACATGLACDAFLLAVNKAQSAAWRAAARQPSRELFARFVAIERARERPWRAR